MSEKNAKPQRNSSFLSTAAMFALGLSVVNTFVLAKMASNGQILERGSDYSNVRESVSKLRTDVDTISTQVGAVSRSAEELALRQALLALENVEGRPSDSQAYGKEITEAKDGIQRLLMRFKGLEPPTEEATVVAAEVSDANASVIKPEEALSEVLTAAGADQNASVTSATPADGNVTTSATPDNWSGFEQGLTETTANQNTTVQH